MKLENVIERFNTTPILFVGSGITRRYYDLPDWEGLLDHFAQIIKDDEFVYNFYKTKSQTTECKAGLLPKIAELIQQDYDLKWFSEPDIRTVGDEGIAVIKQGFLLLKLRWPIILMIIELQIELYINQGSFRNAFNYDRDSDENMISQMSDAVKPQIATSLTSSGVNISEQQLAFYDEPIGVSVEHINPIDNMGSGMVSANGNALAGMVTWMATLIATVAIYMTNKKKTQGL